MVLSARGRAVVHRGGIALVLATAAATRLWALDRPGELVFDETYYVKDAWTLWNLGYEAQWPDGADAEWNAGSPGAWEPAPSFVVHPPLGKWIIALGMALLGPDSPWGWRITTALAGIVLVALTMLAAHLLFRLTPLTLMAGGLIAVDGNAIVMSRVALLDTHLAVFALAGVVFVILDRHWAKRRLAEWRRRVAGTVAVREWGPALWWRPWLLAAGAAFGAATAVKWSGLYFLAVFGIVTVVSDIVLFHRAGATSWPRVMLRQGAINAALLLPIAGIVHLLAWSGWFLTRGGYARNWIAAEGGERWTGVLALVPESLQNWWHYQATAYAFHTGLTAEHNYASPAWQWLLLLRPTSMWYRQEDGVAAEVLDLGNPLIWWAGLAALVALVGLVLNGLVTRRRVATPALVLAGVAAGYLPWFLYPERTMFAFYSIAFEAFLVIALAYWLTRVLAPVGRPLADGAGGDIEEVTPEPAAQRRIGLIVVALFLVTAAALSVFFWPMWSAAPLPEAELRLRFWFRSWI